MNATDVDTSDQGKLTYYFSDKAHNPVTFGKGDVIGHLTLADGTKTEITVTSVKPDGTIVTDYGTFHLDTKTGEYTFTKTESTGNATDQLQLGDKVELDFSISVKDSHGETASSTHDVTVVINGSNDRPSATMQGITVKEAGVHDGNTATTADTDGTLGAGEHRVTSGTLNITNLKDVDDDISKGFGTGRDQFKISLRGLGQLRHAEPQCRRHVDHDSPAEQWRRLQQRQGHPLQLQLPEGRLRQARSAASSRRAAGTESGSHLRQRGFHPLSGGARHPDRQPGRFILLTLPRTARRAA